jgi:hypothetical protein
MDGYRPLYASLMLETSRGRRRPLRSSGDCALYCVLHCTNHNCSGYQDCMVCGYAWLWQLGTFIARKEGQLTCGGRCRTRKFASTYGLEGSPYSARKDANVATNAASASNPEATSAASTPVATLGLSNATRPRGPTPHIALGSWRSPRWLEAAPSPLPVSTGSWSCFTGLRLAAEACADPAVAAAICEGLQEDRIASLLLLPLPLPLLLQIGERPLGCASACASPTRGRV